MNTKNKITMADPWITTHEQKVVAQMMKTGWTSYEYVEKFQREFAAYHGRKYGIMTPNCHQALHLLLLALSVKKGDEVIVPDCTWTGSVAPITYVGAIPVFCDIEEKNWCLDPKSVQKRITKKTKAIIAVGLYGNMPNLDELRKIARKNKIHLIEDAAEALGSKYKGKRAGSFGVGSVFSFHRTKTLTTGEGGMLLLDDRNLYERAMFLRDCGRDQKRSYYVLEASVKYMPSNYQAALGYAQFQRIEALIARKREIFKLYQKFLSGIPDITLNEDSEKVYNGVWATSLVIGASHGIKQAKLIEKLKQLDLPTRPFFYPLSSMPSYAKYKTGNKKLNPVAYSVSDRAITLPASFSLTQTQLKKYANGIRQTLGYPKI